MWCSASAGIVAPFVPGLREAVDQQHRRTLAGQGIVQAQAGSCRVVAFMVIGMAVVGLSLGGPGPSGGVTIRVSSVPLICAPCAAPPN